MTVLTEDSCIRKDVNISTLRRLQNELRQKSDMEKLAELMTIAGNETRLKILYLLSREAELCVCDLADVTDMSVSSISHQLSKLRAHGLIAKRREGQTIFYKILDAPFIKLLKQLFEIEN